MSDSFNVVVVYECSICAEGEVREEVTNEMKLGCDGKIECLGKFYYLGDMIGSEGGA